MTEGISKLTYALVAFVLGGLISVVVSMYAYSSGFNVLVTSAHAAKDPSFSLPRSSEVGNLVSPNHARSRDQLNEPMSLSEMLQIRSEFDKAAALYGRLSGANRNEVLVLFEESKSIDDMEDRNAAQSIIFARLATIDPHEAMNRIKEVRASQARFATMAVFREWSQSNVQAALQAAEELPMSQRVVALDTILISGTLNEKERDSIMNQLGSGSGQVLMVDGMTAQSDELDEDPAVAWHQLTSEPQSRTDSTQNLINVAINWVERDGIDVLDQIREPVKSPRQRRAVLTSVIEVLSRDDPQSVLTYLQRLPQNNETRSMTRSVFHSWTDVDPQVAFAAAAELDRSLDSKSYREAVLQNWSYRDPYAVIGIVETLPDDLRVTTYQSAIYAVIQDSPVEAARLIDDLENDEMQRHMINQLASHWSRMDPQAAIEWIMAQPNDLVDSSVFRTVAGELADMDPEAAFRLASRQSGEYGLAMELGVIRTVANDDIDKAINLLARAREDARFESAIVIGEQLLRFDTDRALRLGNRLKKGERDEYANALVRRWFYSDPYSLVKKIDDLPSSDIQSNAAKLLLQQQGSRRYLSDEQYTTLYSRLNANDKQTIDSMNGRSN